MQSLLQDLRYAARQLVRAPGFALTGAFSLALGIGATTAVFSVIYAALMNPYPYPTANRIVRLTAATKTNPDYWLVLNGSQVQQIQNLHSVESVLAMDYHAMTISGNSYPENVNEIGLIANGFRDLGLPPILGRGIAPSDAPAGQEPQPVLVLSYKFWQRHYFGDPNVLGKTLQLDHKNYSIIGVAAPRFIWYSADVYLPLKLAQSPEPNLMVDLLLKPGVATAAADAELQPVIERFAQEHPKLFPEHLQVRVQGLNVWVVKSIGNTLYLLFGAVALLLAIGCGNLSILLMARGTARQHELAVRMAVGAKRRRIIRQLLTESLLLASAGAALGVALAYGILAGIRVLLPRYAFAPEVVIRINLPVLLFSIAVAVATGILFGLWPALQLSRPQSSQTMQSGKRVAGTVHGKKTHGILIAGQVALTLLLLAGAGSAMEGFARLVHTPLGYDPHNVMSVGIPLHDNTYITWPARAAYFDQLRNKVAETPGVTMTAISSNATPPENGHKEKFDIQGKTTTEDQIQSLNFVNTSYFATLRIPLLQGRIWSQSEDLNGSHVAVINQALARRYFPNRDALGRTIRLPGIDDRPPLVLAAPHVVNAWLPIVGIVADARNDGLKNPVMPAVYVPYTLRLGGGTQILVRSQVDPQMLLNQVRESLSSVNRDQQVDSNADDLETWLADDPSWRQEHLVSWIFGIFSAFALALAAVGLYSVVSYSVVQRTNEFGVRMALGAPRGHVIRLVFASTAGSVGSGILAGLVLTFVMDRTLSAWMEGSPHDPLVLLAGVALLGIVLVASCAIPARHASQVDPMVALRCE